MTKVTQYNLRKNVGGRYMRVLDRPKIPYILRTFMEHMQDSY